MNTQQRQLQPMEVLHAVRRGLALATPPQLERIRACRDFKIVPGGWVPRWALEALSLLESAGVPQGRLRGLFALGHDAVHAELAALVRAGKLPHSLETRHPYQRLGIDLPTEMAMTAALQQHHKGCALCTAAKSCADGAELEGELELLFPLERRHQRRA